MTSRFIIPVADVGGGINPSDGALLYFYDPGTNDPKGTFANEAGSVDNTHPVVSDANGIFPEIWLSGDYKVVLRNKNGDLIDEWDPVRERVIDGTVTDHIDVIDGSASNPSIGFINHTSEGFYHDGTSIRVKYDGKDSPVATTSDIPGSIVETVSSGSRISVDNSDPANPVISSQDWIIDVIGAASDFTLNPIADGRHYVLTGSGTYNITIDSNSSTPFIGNPRVKFTISNPADNTVVNILNGVQVEFDRDDYKLTKHLSTVEMWWSDFRSSVDFWEGKANFIAFNDTDKTIDHDPSIDGIIFTDGAGNHSLTVPTVGVVPAQIREPKTDSLRDITTEYGRLYEQTTVVSQPWTLSTEFRRRHNVTLDNLEIGLNASATPSIFSPQQIHTQSYSVTIIQNGATGLVDLRGNPIVMPFVIPQGELWEFEGSTGGNYKAYRVDGAESEATPSISGFTPASTYHYNVDDYSALPSSDADVSDFVIDTLTWGIVDGTSVPSTTAAPLAILDSIPSDTKSITVDITATIPTAGFSIGDEVTLRIATRSELNVSNRGYRQFTFSRPMIDGEDAAGKGKVSIYGKMEIPINNSGGNSFELNILISEINGVDVQPTILTLSVVGVSV